MHFMNVERNQDLTCIYKLVINGSNIKLIIYSDIFLYHLMLASCIIQIFDFFIQKLLPVPFFNSLSNPKE